ncbi:acyltransferase family protein [Capillimicrobium parvum]|uniref:O-acetyltransferase OatA n=1 Tax=Capillimicrobium parvum TaxID=2884022 RepID=A0A9E6XXX9_9ACTN|nr:acyltransferase [Capillimicrobium parvum]UGS36280.1 O-acetyltransferase OatA [Capillimicrobium parvum]
MSFPSTFQHALAAVRRVNRQPADGSRRIAQLDGLRAVAVLMVIVFHLEIGVGIGGMFGVDLFLVLSGFLITGVLVGEYRARGTVSVRRFYERRLLRLYPALVLMIVVLVPFGSLLNAEGSWGVWWQSVAAALTYTSTIVLIFNTHFDMGALGQTWTLAVEEQFYLLWAPICALALAHVVRLRRMALVVAAVAVALLSIFWWAWSPVDPIGGIALYYRPDPRFGELLLGAALALVLTSAAGKLTRRWDVLLSVGAVAGLVGLWWARRNYPTLWGLDGNPLAAIPLVGVCATLIVARLATSNASILSRLLRIPPLPYVGKISYGLYLWHVPVIVLMARAGAGKGVAVVVTFAAAMLSFHLVEMPFLRMKARLRSTGVAGLDAVERAPVAEAAGGAAAAGAAVAALGAAPVAEGVLGAAALAQPGEQTV